MKPNHARLSFEVRKAHLETAKHTTEACDVQRDGNENIKACKCA